MKRRTLKSELIDWKQRVIRIRPDYFKVLTYLEFQADKQGVERHAYINNVVRFSLDFLVENGIRYEIEEYEPMRKGKGFFLKKETFNLFDERYKLVSNYYLSKYLKKLLVAEFMELIIYIYCINQLTEDELKLIDINWGIKVK